MTCALQNQGVHFRRIALLLLCLLFLAPPKPASAHSADMYGHEQFIVLSKTGVAVDWKISPGPLLARTLWNATDKNADGTVSNEEALAWAQLVLPRWTIQVDGKDVENIQVNKAGWPANLASLESGDSLVEIIFSANWPFAASGNHHVVIHNAMEEAISQNWFSVKSADGLLFTKPEQNNGLLQFDLSSIETGSAAQPGPGLTDWNSGIPNLTFVSGAVSNLAVNLSNSGSEKQPASVFSNTTSALTGLVRTQNISPWFFLGAFLLSLALGSLHALTPGHGKTLVAAYLIGSHGRTRDAVFLGLIVTITHTGSVILLGLITQVATRYILPTLLIPILEIASGLFIVLFGTRLLIQRGHALYLEYTASRKKRTPAQIAARKPKSRSQDNCSAVLLPHTHTHADGITEPHTHASSGEHEHIHPHSHEAHTHALPDNQITWKSLLTLGVSGGLVPCPDAIAILLVAIAVNRIPLGMTLIAAFSLGLALVLIAIGVAMVQGVRLINRNRWFDRFTLYTPVLSAVVVLALGVGLSLTAINSTKNSSLTQLASQNTLAQLSIIPGVSGRGSAEKPLTSPAFDLKTAKILYLAPDKNSHDQLMIRSVSGGDSIQITQGSNDISGIHLSPDLKHIVFTSITGLGVSSIWIVNTDGTQNKQVLDCPKAICSDPNWMLDGQNLLYVRHETVQGSAMPLYSIWQLDTKTGISQQVFQDKKFPSITPRLSFDGKWLSYISPFKNTMVIYNLRDSQTISMPYKSGIPEVWSPVNDSLLYWDTALLDNQTTIKLSRFDLANNQKVNLSAPDGFEDHLASWSPDGQWIAVSREGIHPTPSVTGEKLWLVNPEGTTSRILLDAGETYDTLSWSPDSRYLIYSAHSYRNSQEATQISIVDIATGQAAKILSGGRQAIFLPQ